MKATAAFSGITLMPNALHAFPNINLNIEPRAMESEKSIIGSYGPWVNKLTEKPPHVSYLNDHSENLELWRTEAVNKTRELVSAPEIGKTPKVTQNKKYEYEGLEVEELSWQLPYGQTQKSINSPCCQEKSQI